MMTTHTKKKNKVTRLSGEGDKMLPALWLCVGGN